MPVRFWQGALLPIVAHEILYGAPALLLAASAAAVAMVAPESPSEADEGTMAVYQIHV